MRERQRQREMGMESGETYRQSGLRGGGEGRRDR